MDLSADQAVLDGLETVILIVSATGVTHTFLDAYRLPDNLGEGAPSEGGYLHRETEWHLPVRDVADVLFFPKPGDEITDLGSVIWVIQDVRHPEFNDFWGLQCRRSSITADDTLVDTVTLYPSVDTTTGAGSKVSAHDVADGDFENVPAKIKLRASVPEEYHGKKQFVEVYEIYVASQLPQLHNGDVIKDGLGGGGKVYTVVSWQNRDLIDELSVIVCELRPVKAA